MISFIYVYELSMKVQAQFATCFASRICVLKVTVLVGNKYSKWPLMQSDSDLSRLCLKSITYSALI